MILPHNTEAEWAVLGAMLISGDAINDVIIEGIKTDDLYDKNNSTIFDSIIDLSNGGEEVDTVSVINWLKGNNKLERVGGAYFITGLIEAVPSVANVKNYARIVKEKSNKRNLIRIAQEFEKLARQDNIPSSEIIECTEQKIFALAQDSVKSDFVSYNDMREKVIDRLDYAHAEGNYGISTGFEDIDNLLAGIHNGELIIIAGRPSMGKTALALNMAVKMDIPVAIFSLEMNEVELSQRIMLSTIGVDSHRARTGGLRKDEWRDVLEGSKRENKIEIEDNMDLTIIELRAKARRIKSKKDIKVIIIDYLQLINSGMSTYSRDREIGYITRNLKAMAKELDVPVILLSQLNRESEQGNRPMLRHLRESGNIEQDADVVIFIHRPAYYMSKKDEDYDESKAYAIIAKQRNGPLGRVRLVWQPECTRFENYTEF